MMWLSSRASTESGQLMTAFIPTSPFFRTHRLRNAVSLRRRMTFATYPCSRSRPARCSMSGETPSETSYLLDDSESHHSQVAVDLEAPTDVSATPQNGASRPQSIPPAPGIIQITSDLDLRILFAEFLSTFIFIYISTNVTAGGNPVGKVYNAAIITAIAASFMPVSGCHLNPAVTLALAVTNRVSVKRGIAFVFMQLAASALACYLATTVGSVAAFAARAAISSKVELFRAMFSEFLPMFIIVIVVFQTAVATEQEGGVGNKIAALYIGLTVLACTGTFSGTFNPAVAFGVALMSWSFAGHWILWVGPCVGACLAAFISEHLFLAPASNRRPNSWLADLEKHSSNLGGRFKNLGIAGIIAYGIMNTLYYSATFAYMMFKIGWSSGASGIAQAWIVCWSLSQVTKPIRLGLSILLAPFINRFLQWRKDSTKPRRR